MQWTNQMDYLRISLHSSIIIINSILVYIFSWCYIIIVQNLILVSVYYYIQKYLVTFSIILNIKYIQLVYLDVIIFFISLNISSMIPSYKYFQ